MTTITLTLDHNQEARLLEALNDEKRKWKTIKFEAEHGMRPNASPEGAQYLIDDTQAVLSQVIEAIRAGRKG
jgi:hypothetical protein